MSTYLDKKSKNKQKKEHLEKIQDVLFKITLAETVGFEPTYPCR